MIEHRGYRITAERTRTGYGAEITPNPGILVAGKTKEETIRLAREAVDLWLEYAPMSFREAMGVPAAKVRVRIGQQRHTVKSCRAPHKKRSLSRERTA